MAEKKKSAKKTSKKKTAAKKTSKKPMEEMKGKPEKGFLEKSMGFLAWLTGVIVSLAVGFGMVSENLFVGPAASDLWIPTGVTVFFGWVVVVTTLLSVVLAIIHKLQR